jgi:hypothetical protein
MKKHLLAALLFGFAGFVQAQNSATAPSASNTPTTSSQKASGAYQQTGNAEMIGSKEIQAEIMMSLEDHALSGLNVQVTDNAIDISGKVPTKAQKQLVHDIAAAYLDGRKLHDHIKD